MLLKDYEELNLVKVEKLKELEMYEQIKDEYANKKRLKEEDYLNSNDSKIKIGSFINSED